MKLVGKIIGIIGLCTLAAGIGFIVTKYLDKNLYLDTNLLVKFEDFKEFNLESTDVLDREEALKTYPNKFSVENKGLKGVKYSIILKEKECNVSKNNLSFILYLNDKEVKSGKILELDEVLYSNTLGLKKTDNYKLYIYLTEKEEDPKFTYTLEVKSE